MTGIREEKMSEPIRWTRTEAMACAYCWCEFHKPEERPGTPEQYWLSISERSRQECRWIVKNRYLVAVALRQAAPIFPPNSLTDEQWATLGEAMGLKARHRVRWLFWKVYETFLPKRIDSAQDMDAALASEAAE